MANPNHPLPRPATLFTGATISLASDATISPPSQAIYVGGTGDVKVDMLESGTAITFKAVPVGTILRIGVSKVYSSANGTTATNLVALS